MLHISEIFDPEDLTAMLVQGMVKEQRHPSLPLSIYNYTPKAVYSKNWNPVTLACRGLIVRIDTGEVISRPFPKFFNWDQPEVGRLPIGPAIVAPKMDGSLGVLYRTHTFLAHGARTDFGIATRGSFTSPQAMRATDMYVQLEDDYGFAPQPGKTYLFEIIYPENRIVVDYHGEERLVLLDVIDNATGTSDLAEFDEAEWDDKVERKTVHIADHNGDALHELLNDCPEDEEGLVFYFPGRDLRFKMKKAEYLRLHRIVTGVSTKTVWQTLSNRGNFDELLDRVPDEFYAWVKKTVEDFQQAHAQARFAAYADYANLRAGLPVNFTRKDFAMYAKKHYPQTMPLLFQILDGKDIDPAIWASLRPEYEKPFAQISEDNN